MERKCWAVQIGGNHYIVEMENDFGTGLIRVDGELVERWKGREGQDCHRFFNLKEYGCRLHIRFDPHKREYDYDLSLNGVSIINGKDVPPFSSSPSKGITKRWSLRLKDGLHTLLYQHVPFERRMIHLDGRLVEDSRFYTEEESNHLLIFKGHRIGIHLSQVDKHYFCYDLSIDGLLQETGERIGIVPPSPSEYRKKIWFISLDGITHTIMLEHKGMNQEKKLVVDGQLLVQSGFAPNQKDSQYPFFLGNHRCALSIRHHEKWLYRYDLLVNGISVDTGEALDFKPAVSSCGGGTRIWRVHLEGCTHTVLLKHGSTKAKIWVDKELVGEKNFWKESKDSYITFRAGEHSCALIVRKQDGGEYTYQLFVNGYSVDTGEPLYPYKIQGRDVRWLLQLEGGSCIIRLEHQRLSGKRCLFLDERPIDDQRWKVGERGSIHAFRIGRHWAVVEVQEGENHSFGYHLYLNGQRVEQGYPLCLHPLDAIEELDFLRELKRKKKIPSGGICFRKVTGAISTYVGMLLALLIGHYLVGTQWLGWAQPQPFSWYLFLPAGLTSLQLWDGFRTNAFVRWTLFGSGVMITVIGIFELFF